MSRITEYDLCVIGGGAAGLVVAAGAATLGAKVILIERDRLGGECLYSGCVPSKTLLHAAHSAHHIRQLNDFGLSAQLSPIDQAKVMEAVSHAIRQIEPHDSPERFESLGVEVLFAEAQFIDANTIQAGERTITARDFVLATGSAPRVPDIVGLDSIDYFTHETIFDIKTSIPHLVILGSGPVACEMAQSFVRLGSEVTIISNSTLLAREDADLVEVIEQQFERDGIQLHLGVSVSQFIETDTGFAVQIGDDELATIEGSHLLVATGRQLHLSHLGLDKAGVEIEQDKLKLDKRLRTSNRHIYACGDVAGPYLFTHMAEHQAGVVLRNTLFHWPARVESHVIPWCTFTSPELARVGLSEQEARSQGLRHEVYIFSFDDIDRAITDGHSQGFIKVLTKPNGKLLGAAIVGPHAGELIAEYALAMSAGLSLSKISSTIHLYPSLSQINRRVADQKLKAALTPFRRKWLKRLLRLRG